MEKFRGLARKAAALAPALLLLGSAAGISRQAVASPDDITPQLAASTSAVNNSVWRPFGTVNGITPSDALVKDANGNYTNPDAITAYKALSLYVTEALRYPVHPLFIEKGKEYDIYHKYWDSANRFTGADNPGKLPGLKAMFDQGDERTKAIVVAVVEAAHDQVWGAAEMDLAPGVNGNRWGAKLGQNRTPAWAAGLYDDSLLVAAQADTTDANLAAITKRIASSGLDPNYYAPPGPKASVMECVQATTDVILKQSRPMGSIMAMYKQLFRGPQPNDRISQRTLVANLIGLPYPPESQVASVPQPQ